MFDAERTAFMESGLALLVGSRDARLVPECTRAFAVKVIGPRSLRIWVIETQAKKLFENLDDNGVVSVCLARITDYTSLQAKGRYTQRRGVVDADCAILDAQWALFREATIRIHLPLAAVDNRVRGPCVSFDFDVDALFNQTPGPSAGNPA